MNRRGLFGVLAFVLALVGAVAIFLYVRGADARALAGQQPAPVLVVTQDVPAGTRAVDLGQYVETRQLPRVAVVSGAVTQVDQLPGDNVASTALRVGEQVLASRFVAPGSNEVAAPVPIPEGLQLVSVQLSPERVVGSRLTAGDQVGVFASMKVREEGKTEDIEVTKLLANDVLVVRVQGAPAQQNNATPAPARAGESLPGSEVIVTLAVNGPLAEKVVFTKEFGSVWLTVQTPTTKDDGGQLVDVAKVLFE